MSRIEFTVSHSIFCWLWGYQRKKGKGVNQLNRQHVALHLWTPSHPLHHLFSIYHLIVVLYWIRFCCCNSLHHVCMMYDLCVKPRLLQLLYLLLAATHNQIAPLGLQVGYNRGLLLYNISVCHCMFFPLSCLCVFVYCWPGCHPALFLRRDEGFGKRT